MSGDGADGDERVSIRSASLLRLPGKNNGANKSRRHDGPHLSYRPSRLARETDLGPHRHPVIGRELTVVVLVSVLC